ncbi:MAG: hypothetical protein F2934_10175 [Actinobacteria bacterium]|uniref:Unannotated protein n=1 Tax=freshwater metagenome TaxID=449393 RepID=A0A6J6UNL3_9ZZZZ|nr:hypothetical protein [Actinomycetota bacterium]MSZ04423.1 hypothetical protein [Actinomycetota bacterium]MTB07480.1 hypothetical protein [Actinomycetota bacterium]
MTDDFDDPDLAAALRNIAGPVPSVDAALPVFHRRVRVARIRRVSVAVSGAAAVALIAVGAVALTGNERGNSITPMDPSITLDTVADPSTGVGPSTTTTPTTTRVDDGDTGPSSGSGAGTAGESGSGGTASIPSSGSASTTVGDSDNPDDPDGSDDSSNADDSEDGHNEGSGNSRTTTTTGGRAVTKRCSSAGGSFTASHLIKNSVTNVSPAPGFSKTDQEIESEKITVVFGDNEVEYHVVARWTGESFSCSVGS